MKKRFSDEQIISILREAEAGVSARELCRNFWSVMGRHHPVWFALDVAAPHWVQFAMPEAEAVVMLKQR